MYGFREKHIHPTPQQGNSFMKNFLIHPNKNQPSILGTGLVALDVVVSEEEPSPRFWTGGTCGNVLTILSYLGWQSLPVARLNGDSASLRIQQDLQQWGVRLDFLKLHPSANTPIIVQEIRRDRAGIPTHRFLWTCPKCSAQLPSYKAVHATSAQDILPYIGEPKVFFLDRVSRGALLLAEACATKGALIVFEPAAIRDLKLFREALDIAHIVKYSNDRSELMKEYKTNSNVLLEIETLGHEGLRYRNRLKGGKKNEWQNIDAYQISGVRDTAGAGDWCTAGIIHALGRNGLKGFRETTIQQMADALTFGQALASWNCRFEGARGGMYSVDKETFYLQIEQIMTNDDVTDLTRDFKIKDVIEEICPSCKASNR